MKKTFQVVLGLFFAAQGYAGDGAITQKWCAELNKNFNLCIGESTRPDQTYLIVTGFGRRKWGNLYVTVNVTQPDPKKQPVGVGKKTYEGTAVILKGQEWLSGETVKEDTAYRVELETTQVVAPKTTPAGILKINGEKVGPELTFTEPENN
jgi:hypothetical protein